eukprot:46664_1
MSIQTSYFKQSSDAYFDKNELIVTGYIRIIQRFMCINQIIPSALYALCLSFYKFKITILWKKVGPRFKDSRQFGVLDIENKKTSIITLNKLKSPRESKRFSSLCYIPNINYNGSTLNGILAAETHDLRRSWNTEKYQKANLCMILYESNNYADKITALNEYQSTQQIKFKAYNQFLYCNGLDTVIYEWNANLFGLNVQNISSPENLFKFAKIKQNNFMYHFEQIPTNFYLNMTYLPDKRSIFGICCSYAIWTYLSSSYSHCKPMDALCGIFDMNTNEWTNIKPFKYSKIPNNNAFDCITCYDGSDCVFLYTHCIDINNECQTISKYDIRKNEWIELEAKNKHDLSKIWIDNNIIYGLRKNQHFDKWNTPMHCTFQRYILDLRSQETKWIVEGYDFDAFPNEHGIFSIFS